MNKEVLFSTGKDNLIVIKGGRWGTITTRPINTRFWEKVYKSACWNWTGSLNEKGYGLFRIGGRKGKAEKAHRVSWEMFNGPIPENLHVLHLCDNRKCVNPEHLFLGTHQDNMKDMMTKGRCGIRKALKTRKERHGY